MFSEPPILNDFIYPIPYCHFKTNLNTILNIFQRWNCQQIAIFQENGKWGLIDSINLLSLITEVHLKQETVASGRLGSSMPQDKNGLNSQAGLTIKPAEVYQSDMKLDEFLGCLPKGSLECDRQQYLLVDRLGKLQGKLDRNKILEYLALQYKPNRGDDCQSLLRSNYCLELLDSIPLPLKIETTSGEDLYCNTCWQELIIGDRFWQHQLPKAIASWGIEQQIKTLHRDNLRKAQSRDLEYLNSDRDSILDSSSSSELGLKIDVNSSSSSCQSKLDKQSKDWNYVKIPLTEVNREYQLVLAVEATSLPSPSVTNKLLATLTHELKSPLTGIVGLSNLLEAQKLGQLNQRQTRYVELIHSSGQKMMGIVNDLMKLTTLTEKCCKIESESVDLELLCREVYRQLDDRLQSLDGRDLEDYNSGVELDIEENTTAIASKSHLSCILFHLMREAVEFAKSPEKLKIKISSLSGSMAITISSTTTISANKANYEIDSGLRLAIVEYLTEFIQGKLESDRSTDSCQFTLLLPTTQSGQRSSQPATVNTGEETAKSSLTILCLSPEAEAVGDRGDCYNSLNLDLKPFLDESKHSSSYRHRIIEADGLEQAHTLARIWQFDAIVLEGHRLSNPIKYLQLLQTSKYLSAIPLITLDNETTQAANQIKGLNVYPCLLPAEHRRIEDLMQVIQIAVG